MKKITIFLSLLIIFACEDDKDTVEKDTTPPEVTIISPSNGSTVSIIVPINCISSDNEGVDKVELWIDGQPIGVSDTTEPYSMEWNTITYEDGSYGVTVRSYDTSGNTTDSDPITLTVYKTVSFGSEDYPLETTTTISCNDCGHTGKIPYEIGYMTNLTNLSISNNNQITGEIPIEIGNLTKLTRLQISNNNQLTGEIPSEIGNLTNLEYMLIASNNLMSGKIPSEIGNLTNLSDLFLSNSPFTGEIPSEIGNLTNLKNLSLKGNQLTGSIPSNIGNLTQLTLLWLQENQLTGSIPSNIGNLTQLTTLELDKNQLSGVIPESICDLHRIWSNSSPNFRISQNKLCPPYPSCIGNLIGTQDTSNCG